MLNLVLDEDLKRWQTNAAEFARRELKPFAAEWDQAAGMDPSSAFPVAALRKCSQAGLRSVTVTVELGDSGPKLLVSKIPLWIDSKQGPYQQYM